jgi:hypothetical protein
VKQRQLKICKVSTVAVAVEMEQDITSKTHKPVLSVKLIMLNSIGMIANNVVSSLHALDLYLMVVTMVTVIENIN